MGLKLKRGDTVIVIAGNDKGKIGKVLAVYPKEMRVLVEGVNVRKRHVRPSQRYPQGGIVSKELPIHYSNVMLVDSNGRPTRVSIRRVERAGKMVRIRIAKTTGEEIP
ncbi:MAG: 50S ribosomal protein L24 [Candidatus Kapabacteria bacterium]|nr:50S ribosomal protein L24 [Candidatus Kapabacteria bacterium]MDW8224702.1 50S ribosomal protein L24 [Bacteroidota bacterium]